MPWFEIDREGLGKVLERRGLAFVVFELVQNALDEKGVTFVEVLLQPHRKKKGICTLIVTDNSEEGFRRLSDAWTLFASSYKAGNPNQRGRYNLGEKLVLALCENARIVSTKGSVVFDAKGRSTDTERTERGTRFMADIRMTQEQLDEAITAVRRILPPRGIKVVVEGVEIPFREPLTTFHGTLLTEYADKDGVLRRTRRATDVDVHESEDGVGWVYELGIPVVETGDKWDYDVKQKVPQSMERDNVPPSFLTRLRSEAVNALHSLLTKEDANETWVQDALVADTTTAEAFVAVIETRFGTNRVMADPSDREATHRAIAAGFTVVHGNQLPKGVMDKVREMRKEGIDPIVPAGQTQFATHNPGTTDERLIDPKDYTPGMRRLAAYSLAAAPLLMEGVEVEVLIANNAQLGKNASYAAGNDQRCGRLLYNRGCLGHKFFDDASADGLQEVNDLLIHELGHQYGSNHLANAYHDGLTMVGARLVRAVLSGELKPGAFGYKLK